MKSRNIFLLNSTLLKVRQGSLALSSSALTRRSQWPKGRVGAAECLLLHQQKTVPNVPLRCNTGQTCELESGSKLKYFPSQLKSEVIQRSGASYLQIFDPFQVAPQRLSTFLHISSMSQTVFLKQLICVITFMDVFFVLAANFEQNGVWWSLFKTTIFSK